MTDGGKNGKQHTPGHISSEEIHDGRIVHLSIDTVRFPDGSSGELEMIRHSGAAAVLLRLPVAAKAVASETPARGPEKRRRGPLGLSRESYS